MTGLRTFARSVLVLLTLLSPTLALAQSIYSQTEDGSHESMKELIRVLKDDQLRSALIDRLEQTVKDEKGEIPESHGEKEAEDADRGTETHQEVVGGGLLDGVQQWAAYLRERLPTAALGAPVNVKIEQARAQIGYRLESENAIGELKSFIKQAVLGWALVTGVSFLAVAFAWPVIRTRKPNSRIGRSLSKEALLKATVALIPLVVGTIIAGIWARMSEFSDVEGTLFLIVTLPLVGSVSAAGLFASSLVFLVQSKGARLVSYAQRRLSPFVAILSGIAIAGSVAKAPQVRIAIGPATGDIVSLLFDLAVPIFAIVTIIWHRRTVRSLIVRGYSVEEDGPLLDRAARWVGEHWHQFGFVFALLNIAARIFGSKSGNFLAQSSFSVLILALAFISVTSIRRLELKKPDDRKRRRRKDIRSALFVRFSKTGYRVLQILVCLVATTLVLSLWNIDAMAWMTSSAGASVVGPLLSIVIVVMLAWMLWVILDVWISAALEPEPDQAHRARSTRVMTILPLLRNVAFVVLSVLTAIGVLSNLGINVAPLIAGAGVVGLAVGFGSQQLVADVITGLFILLEDTLSIGDVVNTGDRSGTVEALTIRTIKIRDGDGSLHSIPFSTIKALKNSSRGFGVYVASVTLDFDADVDRAIAIFKELGEAVCKEQRFSSKIVAPLDVWGVDQLGPEGIVLKGAVKTLPLQQYGVGREINRRLNAALRGADIPLADRRAVNETAS